MVELHKFSISNTSSVLEGVVHVPKVEHFFHGRLNQLHEIVRHHFTGHAP